MAILNSFTKLKNPGTGKNVVAFDPIKIKTHQASQNDHLKIINAVDEKNDQKWS